MINLIFGSSFWTMFARFTLLPILFVVFSLTWRTIAAPFTGNPVTVEPLWMVGFNMVCTSLMGWGLAFWRFDPDGTPSKLFWVYPLIAGLAFVPALLFLVSIQTEPTLNERLLVSLFAAIAGPIMALVIALLWRHAPNLTALKKSDT